MTESTKDGPKEPAQASSPKNAGVFEGVTVYHRLFFFTAAAGWLFDCMGQRFFVLSAAELSTSAYLININFFVLTKLPALSL